ncbi:uncharacterized protein G2W53_045020 [Senna tora]|uniref:Uncharacterized protein n=1 Tax=Senna tora TaxID=362788 RepID=A0A834W198_9FABA|nr:uncharacterized protein G2W53_045020 [Senna tora]
MHKFDRVVAQVSQTDVFALYLRIRVALMLEWKIVIACENPSGSNARIGIVIAWENPSGSNARMGVVIAWESNGYVRVVFGNPSVSNA